VELHGLEEEKAKEPENKRLPHKVVLMLNKQTIRCINPHLQEVHEFDPAKSDSRFPRYFCSSDCELDWLANRLQELTLLEVVEDVPEPGAPGSRRVFRS
jgi:hypothetical protein